MSVGELYDSYTRDQLRAEVDRLREVAARATNAAENDRRRLVDTARAVLQGVGVVDRARHMLATENIIAGQTMTLRVGTFTLRTLLEVLDARATEAEKEAG